MARRKSVKWFKYPQPVIIGWQDAQSVLDGWRTPREISEWRDDESTARCKTMGMLLGESKSYYILAACNQADGDYYSHCQRIPKGCITDVEHLKRRKQRTNGVPRGLRK